MQQTKFSSDNGPNEPQKILVLIANANGDGLSMKSIQCSNANNMKVDAIAKYSPHGIHIRVAVPTCF